MSRRQTLLLSMLVVLMIAFRLIPYALNQLFGISVDPETTIYPWNFSPLPAICLFGAASFRDRRMSFLVPFAAYFLGDLGIWALSGRADWAFYWSQPAVYLSLALIVTCGFSLRNRCSATSVVAWSLFVSVLFFVITNLATWGANQWGTYSRDWPGLVACFTAAIPFFRNYLISTVVFSGVLFAPRILEERRIRRWEASQIAVATLSPAPQTAGTSEA